MKAWRLIPVLALLGCVVPAWAQPVTLRHKFVPDDLTRYHMHFRGEGRTEISGMPEGGPTSAPIQLIMTMDMRQRVVSVTPEGVATLRNALDRMAISTTTTARDNTIKVDMVADQKGLRTTMQVNGRELPRPHVGHQMAFFLKPFTSKMDARGRILEMNMPGAEMFKELMPGFDWSAFYKSGQSSQFVLPERPVNVGDTWQDTIKTPIPGAPKPIEVEVESRLLSVRKDATGRTMARIQQTMNVSTQDLKFDYAIPGQSGKTVGFTFDKLNQTVSGPLLWSVDEGKLIRAHMDITQDMVMSMSLPGPQGESEPTRMRMAMQFKMKGSMVRK